MGEMDSRQVQKLKETLSQKKRILARISVEKSKLEEQSRMLEGEVKTLEEKLKRVGNK